MTFTEIKDLAIAISVIITPLIAIFGWRHQTKIEKRNNLNVKNRAIDLKNREKYLNRLEAQISEFYAPIYAIRKQCRPARNFYRNEMPKEKGNPLKIDEKKMQQKMNKKIHDLTCDDYLIPLNKEINDIIKNKAHLIDENQSPEILDSFLNHTVRFEITYKIRTNIDDNYHVEQNTFPENFDTYIESKLHELQGKYFQIINEHYNIRSK